MTKNTALKFMRLMFVGIFSLRIGSASAEDLGYRYDNEKKKCVNSRGEAGLNPNVVGECGQIKNRNFVWDQYQFFWKNISGSILDGSNLYGANLTRTKLNGASLRDVDLSSAILDEANLTNAVLHGTRFKNSSFFKAVLFNSNLSGADLSLSQLKRASFDSANLLSANFDGNKNMNGASFIGATLDQATLRNTYLYGANFREASLDGADFSGAIVFDVDFTDAEVTGTVFQNAKFNEGTLLPFSRSEADRRGMKFFSDPNSASKTIIIQGQVDGSCTPAEVHLTAGEKVTLTLRGDSGQMFLLKIPDLSIELMTMSGEPAKRSLTPALKGAFPFSCGIHGATEASLTRGVIKVM
ncbi:MAG: pentapeptide repeat-containing protein [Bdellovibrionales bacterium]|nr:pentapeptide repeat-containing protein [Bdellovibrionales bacterium]